MFFILSIIALFISLFILYIFVKHDFVIARKSILLQEIFDLTILAFIVFLFVGRLSFIVESQQFDLLSLIKFLHIFRFPGIIFLGGVMGFIAVISISFSKKKILARLLDVYSLSLYPIFLLALLFSSNVGYLLYFNILIFLLSCAFFGIGVYSYKNYTLKDGSIALLFLCLASIFTIISEFTFNSNRVVFSFTVFQIIGILVFLGSAFALLAREDYIPLRRKKS